MYAIINKKTKKFVYGTDRRQFYKSKTTYGFHNRTFKQRTSFNNAIIYEYLFQAITDRHCRAMSNDYKIVSVDINIKKILDDDNINQIYKDEIKLNKR